MSATDRRKAIDAGLAAYARGDWFEAHELLEPAWMGTDDPPERDLLQGLIKLAAAYVHGARSNPAGVVKNLRGARERLAAGGAFAERLNIDARELLRRVDARLAGPDGPAIEIPRLRGTEADRP
jgi:predicted metal-dependent hydrolase